MRTRLLALTAAALATLSLGLAGCSSTDAGSAATSAAVQGRRRRSPPRAPQRVDAAPFAEVVATPA